jgi:hypothetical protein
MIEWVGHSLWLAKAKPPTGRGSFPQFRTDLARRTNPASPGRMRVVGQLSVNLSLATCASRGMRFKSNTTLNNGYLGSRNDEERSEMRYLM